MIKNIISKIKNKISLKKKKIKKYKLKNGLQYWRMFKQLFLNIKKIIFVKKLRWIFNKMWVIHLQINTPYLQQKNELLFKDKKKILNKMLILLTKYINFSFFLECIEIFFSEIKTGFIQGFVSLLLAAIFFEETTGGLNLKKAPANCLKLVSKFKNNITDNIIEPLKKEYSYQNIMDHVRYVTDTKTQKPAWQITCEEWDEFLNDDWAQKVYQNYDLQQRAIQCILEKQENLQHIIAQNDLFFTEYMFHFGCFW